MRRGLGFLLLMFFMMGGCPKKEDEISAPPPPPPPPAELLDELSAARSVYGEISPLNPPAEEVAVYQRYLAEAENALNRHDYPTALEKARMAHLEAERMYARLVYGDLLRRNPPPELTYHYRQNMQASEQAEAAGDLVKAVQAAQEARRQAQLAIEYLGQCMEKIKKELAEIKSELEKIYRADFDLIQEFWDVMDLVPSNDCNRLKARASELDAKVSRAKSSALYSDQTFVVSAPPDFIRQFGDPIMYAEVTSDGRLQNRLNKVPVGTRVKFIRCFFYSRTKTYYLVEDPRSGIRGWMGERYVWPERAAMSEGAK